MRIMGLRGPNALAGHPAAGGGAGPHTDNSGLQVQHSAGQLPLEAGLPPSGRGGCLLRPQAGLATGDRSPQSSRGQALEEVMPLVSGRAGTG